jgi:hypothetical protein
VTDVRLKEGQCDDSDGDRGQVAVMPGVEIRLGPISSDGGEKLQV